MERLHTGKTPASARTKANAELRRCGYAYCRATRTWWRGGEWNINLEMRWVSSFGAESGVAIIHNGRNPIYDARRTSTGNTPR